jgi:hypothetical protein
MKRNKWYPFSLGLVFRRELSVWENNSWEIDNSLDKTRPGKKIIRSLKAGYEKL